MTFSELDVRELYGKQNRDTFSEFIVSFGMVKPIDIHVR